MTFIYYEILFFVNGKIIYYDENFIKVINKN